MAFKKTEKKIQLIEGVIEKIEHGEFIQQYVGMPPYRISKIYIDGSPYSFGSAEKEFPVKEGDNVYFRAIPYGPEMKIQNKSLGHKITIPSNDAPKPEISSDILKKLQDKTDQFRISDGSADWMPKGAKIKP